MNNQKIIEVFKILIKKYRSEQQSATGSEKTSLTFKIRTFTKAITIIKSLDFDITAGSQLKEVKGIGDKTIKKIDEILKTGTLESLKNVELNNTLQSQDNLTRITGIGPVKAKSLLQKGITLQTLQEAFEKGDQEFLKTHLTHHSILGVKYLNDLEKRIPALEIAKIGMFLRKQIVGLDVDFTICGSFRRKKPDSGDIDVLFYPKKKYEPDFLPMLVDNLIKKNF